MIGYKVFHSIQTSIIESELDWKFADLIIQLSLNDS